LAEFLAFDRRVWTLPRFRRAHDAKQYVYVTEYDDSLNCRSETLMLSDAADVSALPYDGQLGSGIVEHKLSELI
jgi:hypothetical protein